MTDSAPGTTRAPTTHLPSAALLDAWAPLTPVSGSEGIVVRVAPDVFGLWEAWEKECGSECPIPYWAVAWPAAVVMARYLADNPSLVCGRSVLDLGCGGGTAGIAALRCGAASVQGVDIDEIALHVARQNAAACAVDVTYRCENLLVAQDVPSVDVVLAVDLFYERGTAVQTLALLRRYVAADTTVLIADGGRAFAPTEGVELLHEETVPVNKPLEGTDARTVRILRLA